MKSEDLDKMNEEEQINFAIAASLGQPSIVNKNEEVKSVVPGWKSKFDSIMTFRNSS